jgi:hypothetical protein
MWIDSVVDEIRAIRRRHTDKFAGDVHAICEDVRKREIGSSRNFVTFAQSPRNGVVTPLGTSEIEANSPSPAL